MPGAHSGNVTRVNTAMSHHQPRQNCALRGDQFSDPFFSERQHLGQLLARKSCFLARTLQFHEFAIFSCDKIEIHAHGFVFLVIQIEN